VFKKQDSKTIERQGKNWTFVIFMFYTIVVSSIFGYLDKTTAMGLSIALGAIGMAFSHIDKIKRFKGASFEAEMKEVVSEAYATIEQMKYLAALIGEFAFTFIQGEGRAGGIEPNIKIDLDIKIVSLLEKIGLSKEQIINAKEHSNRYILHDHVYHIFRVLERENINKELTKKLTDELEDTMQSIVRNKNNSLIDPKELRKYLKQHNAITQNIGILLDDLEYFYNNKKLRRPDKWYDRKWRERLHMTGDPT